MTSSGTCYQCGKISHNFHYTRPRKDAFDTHEGYWHCEDHGPKNPEVGTTDMDFSNKAKPLTSGMNRAERRYFKRTGKVRA